MAIRVLVIHNIINPHVWPYFERLASDPEFDVTVWFLAERTSTRLWDTHRHPNIKSEVLPGWTLEFQMEERVALHLNPSLFWRIGRSTYDVVVLFAGWDSPSLWIAAAKAELSGLPLVLRCGSVPGRSAFPDASSLASRARRVVGRAVAKRVVKAASTWVAYGSRSARYLEELGAAPGRIFKVWNTTDVDRMMRECDRWRAQRGAIRSSLRIRDDHVFILYTGRFQPVKNVDRLIAAYARLREKTDAACLGLVGYGPCEPAARNQVRDGKIQDVHFFGAVTAAELPKYYSAADVFVLPSSDIWGLVVNEAMAAGLPLICSDSVGSSDDLLKTNVNGFQYPSHDISALAACLENLVLDASLRDRMGRASRQLIRNFTYETSVPILADAIKAAQALAYTRQ